MTLLPEKRSSHFPPLDESQKAKCIGEVKKKSLRKIRELNKC